MLGYIQGNIRPEISMAVHQTTSFPTCPCYHTNKQSSVLDVIYCIREVMESSTLLTLQKVLSVTWMKILQVDGKIPTLMMQKILCQGLEW